MRYSQALEIAERTLVLLAPHCERIAIAGSIRRKKPEVKDIEIVAIPKPYETGIFESGVAAVVNKWEAVKGVLPCKYTQRVLPEGIKLDLFFATPENWGVIFAIRTGSAEYSRRVLAGTWHRMGYKSDGGILIGQYGERVELREEEELFAFLGLKYVRPEARNL